MRERGLKQRGIFQEATESQSLPMRERGLKLKNLQKLTFRNRVAPHAVRGLKHGLQNIL